MKLFIAEKPELGRAIAAGLNGTSRASKTYIEKGDNIITWAFGHILGLAAPGDYKENWIKWDIDDLPYVIDEFKYIPEKSSLEQLEVICNLINRSDVTSIVHCGDADDEGQILIDEILEYSKTTKPIERLLINDNTEKGVREALKNIRPNSEFKGMSERGFARSQADWVVGINLTRAMTSRARNQGYMEQTPLALGRVQTPILSLVVNRDNEHESFKSSNYFSISGEFNIKDYLIRLNLKTDEKITDENEANSIKSECESKVAKIDFIKTEKKKENPPLPYSLLKLQVDCSKLYGYKPDEVMEITQQLREKYKAITYNRSDCEYLPTTHIQEAPEKIGVLKGIFASNAQMSELANGTNASIIGVAFDDGAITAHHAIVPTAQRINLDDLSVKERNVYTLIAKRYLVQFFDPKEFDSTSIQISIGERIFKASQINVTKHTFDKFLDVSKDEGEENENKGVDFRYISESDNVMLKAIDIEKKKTTPKSYYTMDTLLKDLTGVAKYAKDEHIKKLLLEKDKGKKGENGGIGTPATRSAHLTKLFERGFLVEKKEGKKSWVISTDKGRKLIKNAPDSVSSIDMTALWYEQQKDIEAGTLTRKQFLDEVWKEVSNAISTLKTSDLSELIGDLIKCPNCGGHLIQRRNLKDGSKFWSCSNYKPDKTGCNVSFPDKNGKPDFEAKKPKPSLGKCPKCQGDLIKTEKVSPKTGKPYSYFYCSNYKNGCKYGCFPDKDGKPDFNKSMNG